VTLLAEPLQPLFEVSGLPAWDLPADLATGYGGPVGFEAPAVVANFVATVDGVAALPGVPRGTRLVSGGSDADRFVVGLLRACADVVLVGAGTLRAHPRGVWTPDDAWPAAAAAFADLRARRGLPTLPALAVATASGDLDADHPGLRRGAVVLTTEHGAARLRGKLPAASRLEVVGEEHVDPGAALAAVRAAGHGLVVSEAGPHLFGSLVVAGLVDELFLTQSPLFAGRGDEPRPGLVAGVCLLPEVQRGARLLGVRRAGDHLFTRYALDRDVSRQNA
jgi:riboflavin biosynthesis pyrimidine reductase